MVTIAIDAMGGDYGPEPIVTGVLEALKTTRFNVLLVGDEQEVRKYLPEKVPDSITIVQSGDVIDMHESATDALKRKESSIFKAVDLVKEKKADAVVSAGHSGATMSLATLRIGRLPGISRPAIATLMPTVTGGRTLVLDVGANVDSKPEHLVQFAIMGKAYAMDVLNHKLPRVGLLANGEESSKGNEVVKETHKLLSEVKDFNFIGNVEGNDIFNGNVDVVVCDGFVGNVLLKTSEGVAEAIRGFLKKSIKESLLAILGSAFMLGAFKSLKKQIDYAEYGGAPLLGVNGCAIVSHGKSNSKAIKNAIFQAVRFVDSGVNEDIKRFNERYQQQKD
jgi:glycerol-3-phosphate acyltransferase PlsX